MPVVDDVVIRTEQLTKVYPGGLKAVDELDLEVHQGEIFGLLGPNGAGKTTTAGMLTTRVIPTSGRAFVGGIDVVAHPTAAKQVLGVVPQSNTLDRSLTVWENLYFHGRYFGMDGKSAKREASRLLEQFRLAGIPWAVGEHIDAWNHVEGAMALLVGGEVEAAEAAYSWCREHQRADGSWPMKVIGTEVEDASGDTNMSAYLAVGVWHHWMLRRDLAFVDDVETKLATKLGGDATVRCRVTHRGIVIEIGDAAGTEAATSIGTRACAEAGRTFAGVRPYLRGAAFLHK